MNAQTNKTRGGGSVLSVMAGVTCLMLLLVACDGGASLAGVTGASAKPVAGEGGQVGAVAETASGEVSQVVAPALTEQPYFGEDVPFPAEGTVEAEVSGTTVAGQAPAPGGSPADQGTVAGRFWNDRPGSTSGESGGIFRGRWISADESRDGVVRGEFEPLPPVAFSGGVPPGGIFHGKFFERQGLAEGLVRGRYGRAPEDQRGFFRGRWFGPQYFMLGILKGNWIEEPEANGGKFLGGWATSDVCKEARSLPDIGFADGDFAALETADEPSDQKVPVEASEPVFTAAAVAEGDRRPPCVGPDLPFGFLRGRHFPDRTAEGGPVPPTGLLHGELTGADGLVLALLAGRYRMLPPPGSDDLPSVPPDDRRLGIFVARLVDTSGMSLGSLRGVFGLGDLGVGVFRGLYFDADGAELGFILGRWDEDFFRPGGPFNGVWNGESPVDGE